MKNVGAMLTGYLLPFLQFEALRPVQSIIVLDVANTKHEAVYIDKNDRK